MNKNSAKRGVFVDLLYFWARVIKYPETLSTYSGKERIMGIDMELVTGWYLREPGVIFERKDQRAPQAFFSGEQEGRFFVSTPIFGVRENAAGRITYVRGIKPANGLKKFPFEFPVIIYCFASTGKG
ncbi:MAG: hypothetical protein NTW60_00005, partial [Candidatus Wolfebacteria bacterium]|nr:hypothetical protein [Candidatus Wolfebacteria bacterium]